MEENIGMRLELRKSGWQFQQLPPQARVLHMWVGGTDIRMIESPCSIDQKESIPPQQYL